MCLKSWLTINSKSIASERRDEVWLVGLISVCADTHAVVRWWAMVVGTVSNIIKAMKKTVGVQPSEGMMRGGAKRGALSCKTIRFVMSVRMSWLLWLTMLNRTKETVVCSGIKAIGNHCASLAMIARRHVRMVAGDDKKQFLQKFFVKFVARG